MSRPTARRIVLAPDKFKGCLPAADVARHLALGIAQVAPDVPLSVAPVADGGEGTVDAAVAAGWERVTVEVTGPSGEGVRAAFARRGDVAVIELAEASGLARLPHGPGPATATSSTSYGTGELVRAALDGGARALVLGVGGSACTDGGAGLLQALGARLLDGDGNELVRGGAALVDLAALDLGGLDRRLTATEVVLAADVDSPLTGPHGAARVYGPQKSAGADEVALLDRALSRWADVVEREVPGSGTRDVEGAGAAGGVGFAALAVLGAVRRPGIEVVLELVELDALLVDAALAVTGEGSLDRQTLAGKAPAGVARAATAHGVPVVAVAGRIELAPHELQGAGFGTSFALLDLVPDAEAAIAQAPQLLERVGRDIGRLPGAVAPLRP